MIKSRNSEHVFWFPYGTMEGGVTLQQGWYYLDEAGDLGSLIPSKTEKAAIAALETYANWLHEGVEGGGF